MRRSASGAREEEVALPAALTPGEFPKLKGLNTVDTSKKNKSLLPPQHVKNDELILPKHPVLGVTSKRL